MRPELAPDAFLRTYLGEHGRFWVIVRRPGLPRVRLDAELRALVELCDGGRRAGQIAREAAATTARLFDERAVERRLAPLVRSGALVDRDAPPAAPSRGPRAPGGLVAERLDEEAAARLRVVPAPSTGFGCDGRGACCSLYDRLQLDGEAAARVARAYGDEVTPGGLSSESALFYERPGGPTLGLAVSGGRCVLVEPDGACGAHRRLGAGGKPDACRTFPLRDVRCGDELHVGLLVECRCVVDFAGADPATLAAEAETLLARRRRTFAVESVADQIVVTPDRRVPRERYLEWRAAAGARLGGDALAWSLAELAALGGRAPNGALVAALRRWLAQEAADTGQLYDAADLQRQLFAWADAAAARLDESAPPVEGEALAARQLLHTHGLLRAPAVTEGLASLALRLRLARAGASLPLAAALTPITNVEYLGRVYGLGRIFDETLD